MPNLGCWGGQIVPSTNGYSPKSAILKCSCGKTGWHTKNIGYIGARSIYNFKGGCDVMKELMTCQPECECSKRELSVDEKLMDHVKDCSYCKDYGF